MSWFRRSRAPKRPLVPVLLPEPLGTEVDELLRRDEQIKAIRLVRERTGLDLKAAYAAVMNRREPSS
jgi:hypothetical protein